MTPTSGPERGACMRRGLPVPWLPAGLLTGAILLAWGGAGPALADDEGPYRYRRDDGTAVIADTLADVPPAYRDSARPVGGGSPARADEGSDPAAGIRDLLDTVGTPGLAAIGGGAVVLVGLVLLVRRRGGSLPPIELDLDAVRGEGPDDPFYQGLGPQKAAGRLGIAIPGSVHARAQALADEGRRDEALALLEQEAKDDKVLWSLRGNLLVDLDRTREALGCYDRALELDARFVPAMEKKAAGLRTLDRIEEALACYRAAAEIEPTNPDLWTRIGHVVEAMGERGEALKSFETALDADARHAPAWYGRARIERALGKKKEAERSLARVGELAQAGDPVAERIVREAGL